MEKKRYYLTPSGLQKYKKEYERLKKLKKEKKLRMKESRDELWRPEDLNPDYEALQMELNFIKRKLRELRNILKNVKVIRRSSHLLKKVTLGSTVTVDLNNTVEEFTIVGTMEANPSKKKLSNESPIGKALLGKKVGETIVIKTRVGNHTCKILKIE